MPHLAEWEYGDHKPRLWGLFVQTNEVEIPVIGYRFEATPFRRLSCTFTESTITTEPRSNSAGFSKPRAKAPIVADFHSRRASFFFAIFAFSNLRKNPQRCPWCTYSQHSSTHPPGFPVDTSTGAANTTRKFNSWDWRSSIVEVASNWFTWFHPSECPLT